MECLSPVYRVPFESSLFTDLRFSDRKRLRNGGVILRADDVLFYAFAIDNFFDRVQILNCGQCINCRVNKSQEWAIRCSLEAEEHEHNYFITLTYDDFNLPKKECVDFNGEVWDSELDLRDLQLFVKQYREFERKNFGNTNIKIFYSGEYGDLNGRPHYHICLFGCSQIPDLAFRCQRAEFKYYKSMILEKCWSDSEFKLCRGFVDVTDFSFNTAAYTARYTMKKIVGLQKKEFLEFNSSLVDSLPIRKQPFIGMSRRPGLAHNYFECNKDKILEEDLVKYHKKYELYTSKPPHYFSKLLEFEYPEEFESLRAKRTLAGVAARRLRLSQCSETFMSRSLTDSFIAEAKAKNLYRSL